MKSSGELGFTRFFWEVRVNSQAMDDLHPVQMQILRELVFRPGSRFSELNTLELTSDHFTYHLSRLVETGLVAKDKDRYSLSISGKKFAGQIDTDQVIIQKQAKIGIIACGRRKYRGQEEYLVHTRLKEPFYGYHGLPTGKIKLGESIFEAAQREFQEETHLTGKPELFAVYHLRHYTPDKDLLKDQIFFATIFFNPSGKLLARHPEGKNQWLTYPQLKALDKPFPDFFQVIKDLRAGELIFRECEFVVEDFWERVDRVYDRVFDLG